MKLRAGFVSNSSSSSYVVSEDLTSFGIRCVALDPSRILATQQWLNVCRLPDEPEIILDPNKTWYITRFITEYESDNIYDELDKHVRYEYVSGQLDGTPYGDEDDPEFYRNRGSDYREDVYIRKEHTTMVVMTADKISELVKETFPESETYEAYVIGDHIEIRPTTNIEED